MKFILAQKQEMTQKFAADGTVIPVTKLLAEPSVVTQVKTAKTDGYLAIQVATGPKRKVSKPLQGHLKGLDTFRSIRELRLVQAADQKAVESIKVGDKLGVTMFAPGDVIQVTGTSKGKGFQGVVKRHGFHGSPKSHGHKDQLRMPGAIGAGGVQHVFKGTRMGGHMGSEQVTVKNLEVVEVDPAQNMLYVKGAVPGSRGTLIVVAGAGELTVLAAPAATEAPVEQAASPEVKDESAVTPSDVSGEAEVKVDVPSEASVKTEEAAEAPAVTADQASGEDSK